MAGRGLPAILAPLHIKNLQPLLIWPIGILFSPFQQAKKGKPYDTGAMPRNDKIKKVIWAEKKLCLKKRTEILLAKFFHFLIIDKINVRFWTQYTILG